MKIEFKNLDADIDAPMAERAFSNVSFRADERGVREIWRYKEVMVSLACHIEEIAAQDPQKQEIAQSVFDNLRSLYKRRTLEYLRSMSRCASSAIVGPANFPVARARKRTEIAQKRAELLFRLAEDLPRKAEKALSSAVPKIDAMAQELEDCRAKLKDLVEKQDFMKKANALYRAKNSQAVEQLFLSHFGQKAEEELYFFLGLHHGGTAGFKAFEFSNNLANIHRTQERLAILTAKTEKATEDAQNGGPEGVKLNGLEIILNHQEDRLQLVFTGKPEEPVRSLLKSHGFKWSPRFSAWQRQLTPNAKYALKRFVLPHEAMKGYAV